MNLEELVFNIYKDQIVASQKFRAEIERKYKLSKREITDIYEKIHNYQLKKYGQRLANNLDPITKEESDRIQHNAKTRRRSRLRNYWENTKVNRKAEEV